MTVRVTGIRGTRDAVARMTQDISATERKLLEWAEVIDDLVHASAASAQTPEGEAWEPRKTTTVRRAGRSAGRRSPEGGTLGIQTGRMMRSIRVNVSRNKATLSVGAGGARYAKYFIGYSSRQPARAILPSHAAGGSEAALTAWSERLANEAVEAFAEGGDG